ncbi:MAG: 2-oxoacid:acceptor oxidoreductase family protein [Firmicutes bacterium]|nr:2-oxoacid:acceptor oxidoreductase family protein [Bacillota bacterium]
MKEVRFHGRYDQDVAGFAANLARAAMASGKYAQVFDSFSPYRPGAPLQTVVRISDRYIRQRSAASSAPDVVVVLDNSLFGVTDVTKGLKPGGIVMAAGAAPESLSRGKSSMDFRQVQVAPRAPLAERKEAVLRKLVEVGLLEGEVK